MTALMRERYLVEFYCWGNALCYHMDGLNSNPIFIATIIFEPKKKG